MIHLLDLNLTAAELVAFHMLVLSFLHFVGDFALQIDKMAINKGSSFKWLTIHVATYSAAFMIVFGWQFAVINFVLHWMTDAVTSRISGAFNKAGNIRMFFATIGFDQFIHMACLIVTYVILFV